MSATSAIRAPLVSRTQALQRVGERGGTRVERRMACAKELAPRPAEISANRPSAHLQCASSRAPVPATPDCRLPTRPETVGAPPVPPAPPAAAAAAYAPRTSPGPGPVGAPPPGCGGAPGAAAHGARRCCWPSCAAASSACASWRLRLGPGAGEGRAFSHTLDRFASNCMPTRRGYDETGTLAERLQARAYALELRQRNARRREGARMCGWLSRRRVAQLCGWLSSHGDRPSPAVASKRSPLPCESSSPAPPGGDPGFASG